MHPVRKVTIAISILAQIAAVCMFSFDLNFLSTVFLVLGFSLSVFQILCSKNFRELITGLCYTIAPLPATIFIAILPFLFFEAIFSKSEFSKLLEHFLIVLSASGIIFVSLLKISYPLFLGTALLKVAKIKIKK